MNNKVTTPNINTNFNQIPNGNYVYYPMYPNQNFGPTNQSQPQDDRFIGAGGFILPFLLGGVTGAAVAPAFYNQRPQQQYYPTPIYRPYPYNYYTYY